MAEYDIRIVEVAVRFRLGPPNLISRLAWLGFAQPRGKVFVPAALRAAIKIRSSDFRQKKFGFRLTNITNCDFFCLAKELS